MWITGVTVFLQLLIPLLAIEAPPEQRGQEFWNTLGRTEIEKALLARKKQNDGIAKNVIIFIGDGMGPNTVTATRIFKDGETNNLFFEGFPHVGLLKTYAVDSTVPDSACTATALFSGVKVNFETVGLDAGVKLADCNETLDGTHNLVNIFKWAQDAGKATGIVTTTRVTHATPSSAYAHSADRRWECEDIMPPEAKNCKDIARQLVEEHPGIDLNVIMGGGRQCLQTNAPELPSDMIDAWSCSRKDGRDLIEDWKNEKKKRNATYAVLQNTGDLKKLKWDTEYVMGIFANAHMAFDDKRDRTDAGSPTLDEMVRNAIEVLMRNPNGFLLMVEGGLIDQAHHRAFLRRALKEATLFDEAVRVAYDYTWEEETLIVVTADHAHSLTINGLTPSRGDIMGVTKPSKADGVPFATLSYLVSGKENFPYQVVDGKVTRTDPSTLNSLANDYLAPGGFLNDEVNHGGVDVTVYANGPMAHLFHSVHEQSYVAHAIAYAAAIGEYQNRTKPTISNSAHWSTQISPICLLLTFSIAVKRFQY